MGSSKTLTFHIDLCIKQNAEAGEELIFIDFLHMIYSPKDFEVVVAYITSFLHYQKIKDFTVGK